jgi:biopolymer transport protein ExbB
MPDSSILTAGGPIIWILAVLSVISGILIVVKLFDLKGAASGMDCRARAIELWQSGDRDNAQAQVQGGTAPADRVLQFAMSCLAQGIDRGVMDAELTRRGNSEVADMSRYLRTLEVIGMVSPLLGLLGTVLGMIQSFQELELARGAANASVLAGGIWQALLTTAAGLIVAIPATLSANLFSSKVDRASHLMEDSVSRLYAAHDMKKSVRAS